MAIKTNQKPKRQYTKRSPKWTKFKSDGKWTKAKMATIAEPKATTFVNKFASLKSLIEAGGEVLIKLISSYGEAQSKINTSWGETIAKASEKEPKIGQALIDHRQAVELREIESADNHLKALYALLSPISESLGKIDWNVVIQRAQELDLEKTQQLVEHEKMRISRAEASIAEITSKIGTMSTRLEETHRTAQSTRDRVEGMRTKLGSDQSTTPLRG